MSLSSVTSAQDYGRDWATLSSGGQLDLDPYFTEITGPRVVLEAVARRLLTPAGMFDDSPDTGLDLRQFLMAGVAVGIEDQIARSVEYEATKDERVDIATATVTLSGETMRVSVTLVLIQGGTFKLVLDVGALAANTQILRVN